MIFVYSFAAVGVSLLFDFWFKELLKSYDKKILMIYKSSFVVVFGLPLFFLNFYVKDGLVFIPIVLLGLLRLGKGYYLYKSLETIPVYSVLVYSNAIKNILAVIVGYYMGVSEISIPIIFSLIIITVAIYLFNNAKVEKLSGDQKISILVSAVLSVLHGLFTGFILGRGYTNVTTSLMIEQFTYCTVLLMTNYQDLLGIKLRESIKLSSLGMIAYLINVLQASAFGIDVGITTLIISSKVIIATVISTVILKIKITKLEYVSIILLFCGLILFVF